MRAEFAALNGMTPKLMHRPLHVIELPRDFRLTARHQRHESRLVLKREQDRFIRCGIAGVQRRNDVGFSARQLRIADCAFEEVHALEAAFGGDLLRCLDQVMPCFDAVDRATALFGEEQIVENKPEIGFTGAKVGQKWLLFLRESAFSPPFCVRICIAFSSATDWPGQSSPIGSFGAVFFWVFAIAPDPNRLARRRKRHGWTTGTLAAIPPPRPQAAKR